MGTAAVLPLGTNETLAGTISTAGEEDEFQVTLTDSGRLTATVQTRPGCSLDTRLSLLGPDGRLLIQSDGQSLTNRDDLIVQHLLPGTYFVKVEGLRGGTGDYTLTTVFQPATPPSQPLRVDFDQSYPYALTPPFLLAGDFNGDGQVDIATSNTFTNNVSVLLGLGDGTFQPAQNFAVGALPYGIVAGDFNSDRRLDLATGNAGSNDASVLLGRGDGTFAVEVRFATGEYPAGVNTADVNGDGRLDLIVSNVRSEDLSVLLGEGEGEGWTFQGQRNYA